MAIVSVGIVRARRKVLCYLALKLRAALVFGVHLMRMQAVARR